MVMMIDKCHGAQKRNSAFASINIANYKKQRSAFKVIIVTHRECMFKIIKTRFAKMRVSILTTRDHQLKLTIRCLITNFRLSNIFIPYKIYKDRWRNVSWRNFNTKNTTDISIQRIPFFSFLFRSSISYFLYGYRKYSYFFHVFTLGLSDFTESLAILKNAAPVSKRPMCR